MTMEIDKEETNEKLGVNEANEEEDKTNGIQK